MTDENTETRVSYREIMSKRTKAGGWTKATLAGWGVPWPPPKGWLKRLTGFEQQRLIEKAEAESAGLILWCDDEE